MRGTASSACGTALTRRNGSTRTSGPSSGLGPRPARCGRSGSRHTALPRTTRLKASLNATG
eukprot:6820071-Lingulodinium_polyedra.AAC.1